MRRIAIVLPFLTVALFAEEPRVDLYGDLLPEGAIARAGTMRLRIPCPVTAVVFSPDGKLLASGGDASVRLRDPQTGKEVRRLDAPGGTTTCVAFSPGGDLVAAGGTDRTVRVWVVASGRPVLSLKADDGTICSLAFRPDGMALAAGTEEGTLRVWELLHGTLLRAIRRDHALLWRVAWSGDGCTLVCATGERGLRRIDTRTWEDLPARDTTDAGECFVAASRDGRRFFTMSIEGVGRIWAFDAPAEAFTLESWSKATCAAWAPDASVIATGDRDGVVQIWEAATGKSLRRLVEGIGPIQAVAFSPNGGTLATGSQDGAIRLWDAATGAERLDFPTHRGRIVSMSATSDGKSLTTCGEDGTLRRWESASGRQMEVIDAGVGKVMAHAASSDGSMLALRAFCRTTPAVFAWNAVRAERENWCRTYGGEVSCVAISDDGSTIAVGWEPRSVHLLNSRTASPKGEIELGTVGLRALRFSPDGRHLAVATGQLGREETIVGPDGRRVDLPVSLWDFHSRWLVCGLPTKTTIGAFSFSPDGRMLAGAGDDGTVQVWEVLTGQLAMTIEGHSGPALSVCFSPTGTQVASGGEDGVLLVHDLLRGGSTRIPTGSDVLQVCYGADGKTLATGGADGCATVWLTPHIEGKRSDATLDSLWQDLASDDSARAWDAVAGLSERGNEAASFLTQRLFEWEPDDSFMRPIIADLDADDCDLREGASRRLIELGRRTIPELKGALERSPSPEASARIHAILEQIERPGPPPDEARARRAVQALELVGTRAAQGLLDRLAREASIAHVADDARASLGRLRR